MDREQYDEVQAYLNKINTISNEIEQIKNIAEILSKEGDELFLIMYVNTGGKLMISLSEELGAAIVDKIITAYKQQIIVQGQKLADIINKLAS